RGALPRAPRTGFATDEARLLPFVSTDINAGEPPDTTRVDMRSSSSCLGTHPKSHAFALVAVLLTIPIVARAGSFTTFESGQVRPLALSPDGSRLFAVNTPDDRLEIFDVTSGGLVHDGSVPVGMEPVAVAARSDGEVWVVNHLSDSISVIDVSGTV